MTLSPPLYLITSNAEAGTFETLPDTQGMEILSSNELQQNEYHFGSFQKLCITSEASIELLKSRMDDARKNAIEVLKDKNKFREMLSGIYPTFNYTLIKASEISTLMITERSVIKPVKGCFGTAVRIIEPETNMEVLSRELEDELNKNGNVLSENVLSKEEFIVEQFIEGEEYAVDAYYDSKGEPRIINIYHHPMPKNKAYLHMIYYSSKTVYEEIIDKAKLFFEEIGRILKVKNFPMHSEFKYHKGELLPVEINTMRWGGMGLGNMIYHSLGVNPYAHFINDTEPDWQTIWKNYPTEVFSYFIAYNGEKAPIALQSPNREKLREKFTQILLEQPFDHQKQLAFGIYCLKETEQNIQELLKIEFDDFFDVVKN